MYCAWCDAEIFPQISWYNLFVFEKESILCSDCKKELTYIEGTRCERCSRPSVLKQCEDCRRWEKEGRQDVLRYNISLFSYNETMKEMIAKWKYRGDYYLGNIFKYDITETYHRHFRFLKKNAVAVPIPLSEERQMERGFNQAKMLADFLPIPTVEALSRVHGEKQSKKTRKERMATENPFFMEHAINKTVILVDDIYTTGTTLRHAATLVKEHGCPEVYSLTLIRG